MSRAAPDMRTADPAATPSAPLSRIDAATVRDVFLNWHLGSSFGWGIVGLNLLLQWANDDAIRPCMGAPITPEALGPIDPLKLSRVRGAIAASNRALAEVDVRGEGAVRVRGTLVDPIGNGFARSRCRGDVDVARCVFEDTDLSRGRETLAAFDAIVVASTWNAELVAAATGRTPEIVFEGIDPSLFCPGERSGVLDPGRFYVYSGGKIEHRKGQDLVLLAFARFSERHRDAVLVTAWHSPWPQRSAGFRGRLRAALGQDASGRLDITRWAVANGVEASCFVDLGFVSNALLPTILREMDVALQASRAEACTSLPVKEAMACAVPVIVARNTGLRDIVRDDNCIALDTQRPVEGSGASTEGWGESDVDEIVAALERAYADRAAARRIGARGRAWLIENGRTWQAHASALKRFLVSL